MSPSQPSRQRKSSADAGRFPSGLQHAHPGNPGAPEFLKATNPNFGINASPTHNRILAVLEHTSKYAFRRTARLARECGVPSSSISRLVRGLTSPSFALVEAVTGAIESDLKRTIDPRDLVSFDGRYPTASVCDLCGCNGCLPSTVWNDADELKPAFRRMKPGSWSQSASRATTLLTFVINPESIDQTEVQTILILDGSAENSAQKPRQITSVPIGSGRPQEPVKKKDHRAIATAISILQ